LRDYSYLLPDLIHTGIIIAIVMAGLVVAALLLR